MEDEESAGVASEEEALTLRMWDGDDDVRGELLARWGATLIGAIRKSYPSLSEDEAEDVVCEAIVRFWVWREKYDPSKSSIRSRLYWFATRVAMEYLSMPYCRSMLIFVHADEEELPTKWDDE